MAQRSYYQLSDLLNFVNATNSQQQNVFVIDAAGEQTMGVATFPQAKPEGVFAASGGSKFYSIKYWGLDKDASGKSLLGITALHELGHSLGLPHTFAGVQYTPCADLCNERIQFSNVKDKTGKNAWFGDFASDTSPHPEYYECNDCTNCDNSKGCTTWANTGTPYTNFMGKKLIAEHTHTQPKKPFFKDNALSHTRPYKFTSHSHCYSFGMIILSPLSLVALFIVFSLW